MSGWSHLPAGKRSSLAMSLRSLGRGMVPHVHIVGNSERGVNQYFFSIVNQLDSTQLKSKKWIILLIKKKRTNNPFTNEDVQWLPSTNLDLMRLWPLWLRPYLHQSSNLEFRSTYPKDTNPSLRRFLQICFLKVSHSFHCHTNYVMMYAPNQKYCSSP